MNIKGMRVAILTHNYFEQAELEEPLNAMKRNGAVVTIISADKMQLQALKHVEKGDLFQADTLLREASSEDYDALIIPGGAMNADALRVVKTAKEWVADFMDTDRPLALICHAPWLLVSAKMIDGRQLTSYHTIKDDMVNAGGNWIDQPVVIDGNLITSRQPDDLPKFNEAIVKMLSESRDSTNKEVEYETQLHVL